MWGGTGRSTGGPMGCSTECDVGWYGVQCGRPYGVQYGVMWGGTGCSAGGPMGCSTECDVGWYGVQCGRPYGVQYGV